MAGEVVGVHIVEALIEDGVHQILNAAHVSRGGGPPDYFGITEANRLKISLPN